MPRDARGLVVMGVTSRATAAEPDANSLHHVAVDAADGDGHFWDACSDHADVRGRATHRTAPESFVDSTSPLIWPCSTRCNSIARVQIPPFHREKQDGKPSIMPRRIGCSASPPRNRFRRSPWRLVHFRAQTAAIVTGGSTSPLAKMSSTGAGKPIVRRATAHSRKYDS